MGDPIKLSIQDGLAVLTLSRPQVGNALDWATVDAFSAACATIAADGGVRAVLVEGEGKTFCVGGDVNRFAGERDPGDFSGHLARQLHQGMEALASLKFVPRLNIPIDKLS